MDKNESVFYEIQESNLKKWPKFTILISSIVIQITGLMFGASLFWLTNLKNFILSVIVADIILFFILCLSGNIGRIKRIPTASLYGNIFGKIGTRLLTAMLLPTGIIWIGWMTEIAAKSFLSVYPYFNFKIVVFFIIAISVASSIKGLKGMEFSGYIQIPVVLLLMILGIIGVFKSSKGDLILYSNNTCSLNLFHSIAFTILTWINFIPFYSDYTRFIKSKRDLYISTAISWIGFNTFVMLCGGIFAFFCGNNLDIIGVFKNANIPGSIGLIIILLCTWTFNDRSFYSFGISADIIAGTEKYKILFILAGGLCSLILTYIGIGSKLITILDCLGAIYSPLLGILICEYYVLGGIKKGTSEFIKMPYFKKKSFIPWIIGGISAVLIKRFQPVLSMFISFLIYYIMTKFKNKNT